MKRNFARWCWVSLGGALLLGSGVARGDWPQPPEDLGEHVISLKEATPAMMEAGWHLAGALAEVKPAAEAVPQVAATANKGYLLWGDLFKTGSCFALYETKMKPEEGAATLGLAEWKDEKWVLRGLWKMPMEWAPREERWSGPDGYRDPQNTVRAPFELEDLIGDKVPEVIVSGEMMKYRQARYVMHFDAKSHGLELSASSEARPVKVGKFVQLYSASGNKAIWQEWTFLEWKDGKLMERAAWHSESPYNNEDPPFFKVRVAGKDGRSEDFRIEWMGNPEVTKDGKPFAKLTVKSNKQDPPGDMDLLEGAWFFEKLTGMAREDFPQRHGSEKAEKPKLEKLEDHAKIEMVPGSGNEEARKRFFGKK